MTTLDISRRDWLILRAIERGAPPLLAREAVSSYALDHPEVDMDERRSMSAWAVDEAASDS